MVYQVPKVASCLLYAKTLGLGFGDIRGCFAVGSSFEAMPACAHRGW